VARQELAASVNICYLHKGSKINRTHLCSR